MEIIRHINDEQVDEMPVITINNEYVLQALREVQKKLVQKERKSD